MAFLRDSESEVRAIALRKLADFSSYIRAPCLIRDVLPALQELQRDEMTYVRTALAANMLAVCPIVGEDATSQYVLPIFLTMLSDTDQEVRINLFKRIADLNNVIPIESIHRQVIDSLNELSRDAKWRTKLSVIEQFTALSKQLGQEFFNQRLYSISTAWLSDKICTIREAAIEHYKQLSEAFGAVWAGEYAVPHFIALQSDKSYLKRQITLLGVSALAPLVSPDTIRSQFLPALRALAQDKVPNIRMNTAKSLAVLKTALVNARLANPGYQHQYADIQESVTSLLSQLATDTDADTKYFALHPETTTSV